MTAVVIRVKAGHEANFVIGDYPLISRGRLCKNVQILSCRLDKAFISCRIAFKFKWKFTSMKMLDEFDFQKNPKGRTIFSWRGLCKNRQILSCCLHTAFISWRIAFIFKWKCTLMKMCRWVWFSEKSKKGDLWGGGGGGGGMWACSLRVFHYICFGFSVCYSVNFGLLSN